MSREYNLNSSLKKVKAGNREDLLTVLRFFGDTDCDFNGDNGSEYTWEDASKNGFDSNVDYLINMVKDIADDEECINTFFNEWMERDSHYYVKYSVQLLKDSKTE